MKKTASKVIEVVIDIICDGCGSSVVPDFQKLHRENLNDFNEFGVLCASYGYGSSLDGDTHKFDLCEQCFEKLTDTVAQLRLDNGLTD